MSKLFGLGVVGALILILLLILLPVIVTIVVGIGLANMLGFTGIFWWSFVILFWLIIGAIFSALAS